MANSPPLLAPFSGNDGITLFEFPYEYPIALRSFVIPGLGHAGLTCGHNRISHFSDDGSNLMYQPLFCGRIECPTCWRDWSKRVVFELALRIEAYARFVGARPLSFVMSVNPKKVKKRWSWDRVNTSLFRRGYRRAKDHGVSGGVAVFHPYRIKKSVRSELINSGITYDVGMWAEIRARVNSGDDLFRYVRLGPHVHSIGFGDVRAHSCSDFVIKFSDDGEGCPREMDLEDVIKYLRYLITHTGVITHLKLYRAHRSAKLKVRKELTHTIREFGVLFRINPKELLNADDFDKLASEIALALGMVWADGELHYPANTKELGTSDKEPNWIPIHQLAKYLNNERWLTGLSYSQAQFWLNVNRFIVLNSRAPFIYECVGDLGPPDDVRSWVVGGSLKYGPSVSSGGIYA